MDSLTTHYIPLFRAFQIAMVAALISSAGYFFDVWFLAVVSPFLCTIFGIVTDPRY